MATDIGPVFDISVPAGADLSAAGNQYKFVKFDGSGNAVVCSAATDKPIGVLQNRPASGQMAEVRVSGGTKLQADAALATPGTSIGTSADGQAAAKTLADAGTGFAVGITQGTPGVAGEVFRALIDCRNPSKAS